MLSQVQICSQSFYVIITIFSTLKLHYYYNKDYSNDIKSIYLYKIKFQRVWCGRVQVKSKKLMKITVLMKTTNTWLKRQIEDSTNVIY